MNQLDDLAKKWGTDKSSNWHGYMNVYSRYLSPLRDQPIRFLEIGLWEGASAKLWEDYFPRAELHFIDISFDALKFRSENAHYHLCNQEHAKELQQFVEKVGGGFDVIIDDGGHTAKQQLTSFGVLFPNMKSRGLYIIEDLHSSYWAGAGSGSTIAFLKSLVDEVNYIGARTGRANFIDLPLEIQGELNDYRKSIRSISFYSSIVIIEKR